MPASHSRPRQWLAALGQWSSRRFGLDSLRARLTFGVVTLAAIGLGSVVIWMSWQMQYILMTTHKDNVEHIAHRLPADVEIYSQTYPIWRASQKAIDNLDTASVLVWVEDPSGEIVAHSQGLGRTSLLDTLSSSVQPDRTSRIVAVSDRYWVLCGAPLEMAATGSTYYVGQDIDADLELFSHAIQGLTAASIIALAAMSCALTAYVRRSLQPLADLGQLADMVSADSLEESEIHLERAPREIRDLAQTYDKMLARLSMSWENQRQFVSNVSHELRTPLTVVSGYLQSILRRGTNLTEMQRDALSVAASEADRVTQLLQDLLTLARADAGHMHFEIEPLDLSNFAEKLGEMARTYSNRPVNVEAARSVRVLADESRLTQVLLNLIDNAVKYSGDGEPIAIAIDQQGPTGCIMVRDRGPGIPLQLQERIFERFYRVDEARARSAGGTGLGLSIVKTLVEGMGGDVRVISKLGAGSTFSVILPLSR